MTDTTTTAPTTSAPSTAAASPSAGEAMEKESGIVKEFTVTGKNSSFSPQLQHSLPTNNPMYN